jgi:hypothetical protein
MKLRDIPSYVISVWQMEHGILLTSEGANIIERLCSYLSEDTAYVHSSEIID